MLHVFQDMPAEMAEVNPFTIYNKDWALLLAEKDGKANAMTISWGGMGTLWNKSVVFVFVRQSRYTKEFMDGSDTFSVNFFGGKEKSGLKYFGVVSGRDEDKIREWGYNVNYHKEIALIDEGEFVIVCKKAAKVELSEDTFIDESIKEFYKEGDYHTMYIGEVVDFLAR